MSPLVPTCISLSEKVQAEIDREIGQSRQPCLADRVNMPYTDAVIHEIQRFGDVVPLGFPKQVAKDTTIGGYFVPKVFILFYSIPFQSWLKYRYFNRKQSNVGIKFLRQPVIVSVLDSA